MPKRHNRPRTNSEERLSPEKQAVLAVVREMQAIVDTSFPSPRDDPCTCKRCDWLKPLAKCEYKEKFRLSLSNLKAKLDFFENRIKGYDGMFDPDESWNMDDLDILHYWVKKDFEDGRIQELAKMKKRELMIKMLYSHALTYKDITILIMDHKPSFLLSGAAVGCTDRDGSETDAQH